MVRTAIAKNKKKPADFKRPKRKVGSRAKPAANVTSVGVTSRRINLLEQSLLQDKVRAAQLTHRRQALPELLQQAGHYNAHVRQRALQGLKELANQVKAENLRANASVLLERFLPTLLDEEGVVRDAAVQAWKAMLPVLRNVLAPFATLVVTYFCSGLTHLQVGVRQDTLKAIDELVNEAPGLLKEDAGREALARLLENFRDLICAAQTQGIRMMNTYDLLVGSETSKKGVDGRKKNNQKGKQKTNKKLNAPSGALALRFAALKVLHKLLLSVSAGRSDGNVGVAESARSAAVATTKTLLLYPTPQLVVTGVFAAASLTTSAGVKASASWQEKVRALLPALLELWLECLEGSTDALSDVHVEHMKYIVECTTAVVSANRDMLNIDAEEAKTSEFFQAALKLREELLAPDSFPMLPGASAALAAASDDSGILSRWHGMNASLAKLSCEYLRLPALMRSSGKELRSEALEQRVCTMQNVLQPLLEVVTLILASASERINSSASENETADERTRLLNAVTQFYVLCTPKSVSFRSCTAFVVEQLQIALRGQQQRSQKLAWPMVMQWVVCLADFLGQLDPQHMELGRRSLLALNSVLKQLPGEFTSGDQMDGVLANLSSFFDPATVPFSSLSDDEQHKMLARTRFDALNPRRTSYPSCRSYIIYPGILCLYCVHLTSCCKSPRIHSDAKSFLVDIMFQRREALDLAHIVSFLISTALAPAKANAQQQRQQLQLVHHVCHTFYRDELGEVAPANSSTNLGEGSSCAEAHQQRSDIPVEMKRELVGLSVKILAKYIASSTAEQSTAPEEIDSRKQEQLLLLDELLMAQQQASVMIRRLRVLQALVQTSSLAEAFQRHRNHTECLLQLVEQQHAGEDDVTQHVRLVRGDIELQAVRAAGGR
ncbi:unnamed protein product [Peronospora destructor]|uniref:Pre-rRNA-processing protein Ipi1 N-terminal domain-containing protein n=1 Tax=Peronospora destructor TaxID=86335 RepID=A0AAV0UBC7_9STRA|nr:unnamed protein product [Peronospora destructor]